MGYCDIDDVQGLNSQRGAYSVSTKPTLAQVNEFIDQISNEIDSRLMARGVGVPVTTPAAFLTSLKLGNSQGAAALAEMAMFPESQGTIGGSPHGERLWQMYLKFRTWLEKGQLPSSIAASRGGPRSFHEQEAATESEPEATYPWQRPKLTNKREY